jgi:hypothetical protein
LTLFFKTTHLNISWRINKILIDQFKFYCTVSVNLLLKFRGQLEQRQSWLSETTKFTKANIGHLVTQVKNRVFRVPRIALWMSQCVGKYFKWQNCIWRSHYFTIPCVSVCNGKVENIHRIMPITGSSEISEYLIRCSFLF